MKSRYKHAESARSRFYENSSAASPIPHQVQISANVSALANQSAKRTPTVLRQIASRFHQKMAAQKTIPAIDRTREIAELDEVGTRTGTYILSPSLSGGTSGSRLDYVPSSTHAPLLHRLLAIFLPTGYPHTVSADYTRYQIFDSLQAFSSSIASLLASRAVLQSLGVGDAAASASGAMLLSVAQESVGRVGTIGFADWASRRIEADVKTYRLLADVFNDASFVLDCLSPLLPPGWARVGLLCAATVSRAVCGVAGGSSKALLSAHFARAGNLGELNAKDSSQETVISLLGMWAGGAVVSRVHKPLAVWIWLVVLLAAHLLTNYAAVRAVVLTVLNRQRAGIVFGAFLDKGIRAVQSPTEVARLESIFDDYFDLTSRQYPHLGVSLRRLLGAHAQDTSHRKPVDKQGDGGIDQLLDLFRNEQYVLWPRRDGPVLIALSEQATAKTKMKAWCHALRLQKLLHEHKQPEGRATYELVKASLEVNDEQYEGLLKALEQRGWQLNDVRLEIAPGTRFRMT